MLLQVIDTLLQIRSRSIPPTPYMNLQSSLVVEQIAKDERKMAERNLSVLKKTLEKSGLLKVETKIVEGFASEEITAFSKKVNADLIVMATHGRSGLGRVVIGSVAESVLRHSPCPVLLIRPHAK